MRRRCARIVRRLGWDHNPVRRRVDRVQTILTSVLLVALLVLAPGVAALVGLHAYNSGTATESLERSSFRLVTATVLEVTDVSGDGAGHFLHERALLQWKDGNGATRVGSATLVSPARENDQLTRWTNGSGALSGRPRTHQQTLTQTTCDSLGVAVILVIAALEAYRMGRRGLDRRRSARWDREWARTAPRWTGQR
ncbi:MAG: hypothetical protein ABIS86_23210 [Streptosporangiaceae bacterium]